MITDFKFDERDQAVFSSEFAARIPDIVIDNHIHSWTKECLAILKDEYYLYKQYKPWTDFDYIEEFTMDDFNYCTSKMFPGKKYLGTFFGLPFPQVDLEKNNQYILQRAGELSSGFYYMPGQFEDINETDRKLHLLKKTGFLGFKPYPDIVHVDNGEPSIYNMLNRSVLEFSNKHGLNIILHLPRKERMHSQDNRRELIEIISNYPNVHFIIAHAGRSFCYYDIEGTIDFLADKENISFDLALINDASVIEYLMRVIDSSRIIYGSDAPLAFTRGKDICINNKHYYVSSKMTQWGLGPMKDNFVDLTFYVYEEIRAILHASRLIYSTREERHLENIFYLNAKKILKNGGIIYD